MPKAAITNEPINSAVDDTLRYSAADYRTRWLMAHNCLHELVHAKGPSPSTDDLSRRWSDYLAQLETAASVASSRA